MKVIFLTLVLLCNSSCVSADYLSAMQSLSGELGVMLSPEIHSVELKAAHRKNKSSGDITSICNAFASRFADAAANYTRCFIENSRPLQLCMNCVKEYLIVNRAYSDLEQVLLGPGGD